MQLSVAPQPWCSLFQAKKGGAAVGPETSGHFLDSGWGEMFMVLLMEALGNVEQQDTRSGCVRHHIEGLQALKLFMAHIILF